MNQGESVRIVFRSGRALTAALVSVMLLSSCGGPAAPAAPKAPEGVSVTAVYDGALITWLDRSDNETGFAIYREVVAGEASIAARTQLVPVAAGEAIGTVGANVVSFLDDTTEEGESYTYAVSALGDDSSESTASASPIVVTPLPSKAPTPFEWPAAWSAEGAGSVTPGGYLALAGGEPTTFNPVVNQTVSEIMQLLDLRGATLLRRGPDTDEWHPYAAEVVDISADGSVIDVKVRDGIHWSDGEPVTADDYVLRYLADSDPAVSPNPNIWSGITVKKLGELELQYTLDQPNRAALGVIARSPLPDHVLGEIYRQQGASGLAAAWSTDVDLSQTVWSGPWVPVSYTPGSAMLFTRNPYYGSWNVDGSGNRLPYLDEVRFTITTERLAGFLAGAIDVLAVSGDGVDDILASGIGAEVLEDVGLVASDTFMYFNWNKSSDPFRESLFRSTEFRQAMSHLLDRDEIIDEAFGGSAAPQWSSVYGALTYWVNDEVTRFEYDPVKAAALLAGLGFTQKNDEGFLIDGEGRELSFSLLTNSGNTIREKIIAIFAEDAAAAGVRVEATAVSLGLLVDLMTSTGTDRSFDAILVGFSGGSRDWPFGASIFLCEESLHVWNRSGACIAPWETQAEGLLLDGLHELDTPAAKVIGDELQELLAQEQPMIYTASPLTSYAWRDYVHGEHPHDLINTVVGDRQLELTWVDR